MKSDKRIIQRKITLNPMEFEEAVSAFLKVKPEPKKPKAAREKKAS